MGNKYEEKIETRILSCVRYSAFPFPLIVEVHRPPLTFRRVQVLVNKRIEEENRKENVRRVYM